jgi:Tol biopolymer transport system component
MRGVEARDGARRIAGWSAALAAMGGGLVAVGSIADSRSAPRVLAPVRVHVGPAVQARGPSRVVAFTTSRGDGPFDISAVPVGGGRVRTIARGPDGLTNPGYSQPAWSPDGRRLAVLQLLTHGRGDPPDLTTVMVTMRSDGSHPRRIPGMTLRDEQTSFSPTWSPDGRYIAFSAHIGSRRGLFAVDWRTGARIHLIQGTAHAPAWSPDGHRVAFNAPALSVVDLRSGQIRRLTNDGHGPAWSPDARHLAFASYRDRNGTSCFESGCRANGELYVMNADGGGLMRLTSTRADESHPTWSPDGQRIAFATDRYDNRFGEGAIGVMNRDGSCYRALSNRARGLLVQGGDPAWQPGRLAHPPPLVCR